MDRRRKRLAALAVAALFLVAIIGAGLQLSKEAGLTARQWSKPDALPAFNGRVTATILSVDRTAETAKIRIEAEAWTDPSVVHTENFVLSPQKKTPKGARSWITTRELDF